MKLNIRWTVYAVAFILTALPTLGAYYSVRGILDSALSIGLSPQISHELENSGNRLKKLAQLDPSHKQQYRADFENLQETRGAYDTLVELAPTLQSSFVRVFLIVFGGTLLGAAVIAIWLNGEIIRSHQNATAEVQRANQRIFYLESRESWRLFAQKLVHEVRIRSRPSKSW